MPIKPEHRHHYRGAAWREARAAVLQRAGHACECRGECGSDHARPFPGRCSAPNRALILRSPGALELWGSSDVGFPCADVDAGGKWTRVVITIAHLDHNPGTNDPDRLRAMCQLCHLRYDRHQHGKSAAETRRRKRTQGQVELWKRS